MEEEKASAYYDELTRKGQGAAKFKQGLGFSSSSSPSHSTAAVTSTDKTSFYNNFVSASNTNTNTNPSTVYPPNTVKSPNQNHLEEIRNKLKKKPSRVTRENPLEDRKDDGRRGSSSRHRSRSRERSRRHRDKEEGSKSNRREHHGSSRRRSRSRSPRSWNGRSCGDSKRYEKDPTAKNVDNYSQLIDGYSRMKAAEKVKAKIRFQLSQTVKKDVAKGVNGRWERFDFNKDAPLDDDDELTAVADDDASVVKNMGRSFRFSAVEAKHEDEIRAAHDKAIFGTPTALSVFPEEATDEPNESKEVDNAANITTTLICDTIITKPQGSWRDRVRKPQD